jgi:hypothetical protein
VTTLRIWAKESEEFESDKDYARQAIEDHEAAFPESTIEFDPLATPGKTLLSSIWVSVVVFLMHSDGIRSW